MTTVAIITRTKDRPTFLKRAIESVIAQTYTDYVHVIVNDGGKKDIVQNVIDSFGKHSEKKIQFFHREVASNAPDTIFNESVGRVDSKYVVIHDDDDTWHPDFLAHTVKHLEDTNSMGVVVHTSKVTEELQADNTIEHIRTERWMPHVKAINLYRQCIDNQMTPIAFLYRRKAYDEIGGYDDSLPVIGDWDFGIRFLQKYDVDFLDPGFALANYHHRNFKKDAEGNTSYAGNSNDRYYTNLLMNKYLRDELAEGRLGVGYIMSKLRYDQSNMAQIARRILPQFVTKCLKNRIEN